MTPFIVPVLIVLVLALMSYVGYLNHQLAEYGKAMTPSGSKIVDLESTVYIPYTDIEVFRRGGEKAVSRELHSKFISEAQRCASVAIEYATSIIQKDEENHRYVMTVRLQVKLPEEGAVSKERREELILRSLGFTLPKELSEFEK